MAIDNYILSFDLSKSVSQVEELEKSFTNLSKSIGDVSKISTDFAKLERTLTSINTLLDTNIRKAKQFFSVFKSGLSSSLKYVSDIDKTLLSINKSASEIGGGSVEGLEKKIGEGASSSDSRSAEEIATSALQKAEQALKLAAKSIKEAEKVVGEIGSFEKMVGDIINSEVRGAKSKISGILGNIGGGGIIGGGIFGSIISMIVLGITEKQRLGAERGEMLNIFEATNDVFTKKGQEVVSNMAKFAEEAQFKFAIGRKEVQSVVKQLVDIGFSSKAIGKQYNDDIYSVNNNIVNMTLSLDKHLGLATGTSMQGVVELITKYGESIDTAGAKYKRLALAAQESGIGIGKFIEGVMSGSSAMAQYGIEVKDVEQLLVKIKGHYEGMGLDEKQAGDVAVSATKGITGGLANLGEGWKALVAKKMFPEMETISAMQKLQDGMARISEGARSGFLIDMAKAYFEIVKDRAGSYGSEEERRAKMIASFKEGGSMSHTEATAFHDVAEKLEKGHKLSEAEQKTLDAWGKSFETEGKQLTDLQKNQRELIRDLAKIGDGLLKILTGILGVLIMGFKSLPTIAYSAFKFFSGEKDEAVNVLSEFSKVMELQYSSIVDGVGDVFSGVSGLTGTLGDVLKDIGANNLLEAIKTGPFGVKSREEKAKDEVVEAENELKDLEDRITREKEGSGGVMSSLSRFFSSGLGGASGEKREALRDSIKQDAIDKVNKAYQNLYDTTKEKEKLELPVVPEKVNVTGKIDSQATKKANDKINNSQVN